MNKFFILTSLLLLFACSVSNDSDDDGENGSGLNHESWSYNLSLYEVNTRQYTQAGTFEAFSTHLNRLAEMGVGILWFMPLHPIGIQNRLGSMGSPYAVKDYLAVNPDLGTMEDFKELVDEIHARGMYVIIDWVANHTAWDNSLTVSNPQWYVTDINGNFVAPPGTNWSDVIQLDYSKMALRDYMTDAMLFWITETGIDGFRCDAAGFVPSSFWTEAIKELKKVKPGLLMLAEGDSPEFRSLGFDMTYAWGMYGFGEGVLFDIANNFSNADDISNYLRSETLIYSGSHYRLYFTSNHDENSWYGTDVELFGDAAQAFKVLTATINGMTLIYNGQEAGLNKRLSFFDKDEISWHEHPDAAVYKTLLNLKRENRALWNGSNGGLYKLVASSSDDIFSFVREKEDDKIFAVFNLGADTRNITFSDTMYYGKYVEVFSNDTVSFDRTTTAMALDGWDYSLFKSIK